MHVNFMALSALELQLLLVEILHCRNRDFEPFLLLWPWPWPDDLHIRIWPISHEDLPDDQKWTSYIKAVKSYITERQTDLWHRSYLSQRFAGGNSNNNINNINYANNKVIILITILIIMMLILALLMNRLGKKVKVPILVMIERGGPELIPDSRQSACRWHTCIVMNPVVGSHHCLPGPQQHTCIVINPTVGCHYFPPGLQLPSQPSGVTALRPVPSYTAWWQRHIAVIWYFEILFA